MDENKQNMKCSNWKWNVEPFEYVVIDEFTGKYENIYNCFIDLKNQLNQETMKRTIKIGNKLFNMTKNKIYKPFDKKIDQDSIKTFNTLEKELKIIKKSYSEENAKCVKITRYKKVKESFNNVDKTNFITEEELINFFK